MEEEINAIAERILKHRIETALNENWSQEDKDRFVRGEGRLARKMAEMIVKGKQLAAREARFREALGIRLRVPKKRPAGK